MSLPHAERLARLRLIRSENVGPASHAALIARYGSAERALEALPELIARGGRKGKIRIARQDEVEAEIEAAHAAGARYIMLGEADYPKALEHLHGGPPVLCVKGDRSVLSRPGFAIVGSRNASALGLKLARKIASEMTEAGYFIVSGLARGIDTAAHHGSADLAAAAVLAGGVDVIYPPENAELYDRICRRGVVISENPPGFRPRGRDFPRRNRIVSGMALGTLVVEAAARSGSLITARLARDQGREVFAMPGSAADPRAEGTNDLIRQGATLTRDSRDILEELAPMRDDLFAPRPPLAREEAAPPPVPPTETGDEARARIVGLLGVAPIPVDELIRLSGESPGLVQDVLLELDLDGRLNRDDPGRVGLAAGPQ